MTSEIGEHFREWCSRDATNEMRGFFAPLRMTGVISEGVSL